jgi:hypothetical protein
MYIVGSINRNGRPINGAHRMPGRVFAIAANSPLYQAAHELGHNLGMDDDNTTPIAVMNENVADSGFPVFSAQQINQYIHV